MVTIRADGTNPTGTVIATLSAPASITANAVNTYTAPANTVLAANTTYWLRVDATSSAPVGVTSSNSEGGATGWSIANSGRFLLSGNWNTSTSSIQFSITGQANLPPVAPTNLTATGGNAQVSLSWSDPGNSAISKYQVRQATTSAGVASASWTDIASSGATTTSHTVTGLTNGTAYYFQIRAVAGSLNGTASSTDFDVVVNPVTPSVSIARQGSGSVTEGADVVFRVTARQ